MRATILLPPTSRDTFAAASPLTTSVIVPGSLLRVLSAIVVPPLQDRALSPKPGYPDLVQPTHPVAGSKPHSSITLWPSSLTTRLTHSRASSGFWASFKAAIG